MKKEKFINLRQGNRSVQEYVHSFNYISQYAQEDVSTDKKKQHLFKKGLSLKLQSHLNAFDFPNFHHFVSKAINQEESLKALEAIDHKRATPSPGASGSNQRARTGPPPPPPPQAPIFRAPQPIWMACRPPSPQNQAQRSTGKPGGGGSGFGPRGPCCNCGWARAHQPGVPLPKKGGAPNAPIKATQPKPTAK